jgi:melibiose permease/lactose/raffinose/galactose permease
MASALTVAIANLTYIVFGILKYTNGISELEQAANAGEMTSEAKADAITELLKGVQRTQSSGLLIVMTVVPLILMYLSYILYAKKYTLDEPEYERICNELEKRRNGAAV